MKFVWAMLLIIVVAGLVAVLMPTGGSAIEKEQLVAKEPTSVSEAITIKPPITAVVVPPPTPVSTPSAPTTVAGVAHTKAIAGGLALGLDRTIPHATVVAGSIVRQPDGSLLADGVYRIEGDGTRASPYRVGWDCLASASSTFVPRLKENKIPQRISMLAGAWVRVEGYVAFPLMLQESSEVLAMLNQWDGCCIGVPPTPYDAIEVKLAAAVKPGRRHTFNFGHVTGRFRVDPLLIENWLVGLYQLEEATLEQSDL